MTDYASTEWCVRWENGKTQTFVPYDSYGMSSFIKRGAEQGKVFINDREIVVSRVPIWTSITDSDFVRWEYIDTD